MEQDLPKLIVRRIIADVGAAPNAVGKTGLTVSELLLNKVIKVNYDDGVHEHDVYSGKISIESTVLKGLLVDLTIDIPEYLFVFRMDNMPIHAAKALYDEIDLGETFLRVYYPDKEKEPSFTWRDSGLYIKARMLSDFEKIVSYGFMWEDCKDIEDLYEAAVSLIDVK